jgi:hypothetical protein
MMTMSVLRKGAPDLRQADLRQAELRQDGVSRRTLLTSTASVMAMAPVAAAAQGSAAEAPRQAADPRAAVSFDLTINSRTRHLTVDPVIARSQLIGGLIWGVSSALHEATEIDRKRARYTNTDLAEYLIPVNADIDVADVILVPEEDRQVNELGIKGLGELGNVGTNAAVANAVYHATGVRIRELPIRLEKLLDAAALAL